MKSLFITRSSLVLILGVTALGALRADEPKTETASGRERAKPAAEKMSALPARVGATLSRAAALSSRRRAARRLSLWDDLTDFGWLRASSETEQETTEFRLGERFPLADGTQPLAAGQTLTVNGTYPVTTSDTYQVVQVGVTAAGIINHSAGTFTVPGEIDLGVNAGFSGTYNLSGTGILNVADLYVGGSAIGAVGAFVQTGGTVTASDGIDIGSSGGTVSTYSISAGTLNTLVVVIGDLGVSTFTQTGGTVTTASSNPQGFQFGGLTGDTYQLTGGTLTIPNVYTPPAGTGTGTFNFNGGTLQANGASTTFMTGLLAANVQAGGAKIDTNSFNITIAQPLIHNGTGIDGGLTKQTGLGTLVLTGTSTYNGPTVVSAGTLQIDNTTVAPATTGQLTATNGITLNNGGTLLLSGSASVTDRLNNAAPMTINGGGKFATGGLREGMAPTAANGVGGAVGLGALTLATTTSSLRSTIDFSTGSGSALVYSSLAASSKGAFVSILNWTGTQRSDSGATTNDRLLFTSDPGFTLADLANWQFTSDTGTNFATGGLEIAYNGYYEIVPVPEPATVLGGALLLGAAAWHQRKRLRC